MWYMVQPLMGLVLGGHHLPDHGRRFPDPERQPDRGHRQYLRAVLPYLAAVLAGFRQNFIYEQFDRLIVLFTPAERRESDGD